METKELPKKTFRQVHEDIEKEACFLQKDHNTRDFSVKADFLEQVGFGNSIATKLYRAVSESEGIVREYHRKYNGQFKFILKPQLQRICEKYNLYVRACDHYMGDIPEKNIKDMQGFEVCYEDLNIKEVGYEFDERVYREILLREGIIDRHPVTNKLKVKMYNLGKIASGSGHIKIAAVREMFAPSAFSRTQERIPGEEELRPKNEVELDPIVLCETRHGYIVVTAWGDEANDELVVNQNNN